MGKKETLPSLCWGLSFLFFFIKGNVGILEREKSIENAGVVGYCCFDCGTTGGGRGGCSTSESTVFDIKWIVFDFRIGSTNGSIVYVWTVWVSTVGFIFRGEDSVGWILS